MKTISVTLLWAMGSDAIWRVHGVTDNVWHAGKAEIGPGTYTLRFDINGDEYRGGIDDILITPGSCPPLSEYSFLLEYNQITIK